VSRDGTVPHPDGDDPVVTHPERVLFPADGITKGDIVAYYARAAERMLPHLTGRPLVLERFRKDIDAGGFYQQGRPDHFPAHVGRVDVTRSTGEQGHHTGADSARAVAYLANQGVLTFHAWTSRVPDLEHPDVLVIDLDPPEDDFAVVREASRHVRDVLAARGLAHHPLLTGSTGLHVHVPLDGTRDWEATWALSKEIGAQIVKAAPQDLTRAFYKSQRRGRLFVDTHRARRGHAAVVPWSVRARPGAPVAAPVTWDEVDDPTTNARSVTLADALQRPADPWAA
jgi:bifunctional non-homologous end joining protein LigD